MLQVFAIEVEKAQAKGGELETVRPFATARRDPACGVAQEPGAVRRWKASMAPTNGAIAACGSAPSARSRSSSAS